VIWISLCTEYGATVDYSKESSKTHHLTHLVLGDVYWWMGSNGFMVVGGIRVHKVVTASQK
jgi:hypothetical protein